MRVRTYNCSIVWNSHSDTVTLHLWCDHVTHVLFQFALFIQFRTVIMPVKLLKRKTVNLEIGEKRYKYIEIILELTNDSSDHRQLPTLEANLTHNVIPGNPQQQQPVIIDLTSDDEEVSSSS